MTNKKHIFSIIFIGSLLTGCATGPSPTGIGLYTDVKGPITATSLPATKTGKACAQTVLGIVIPATHLLIRRKKRAIFL